MPPPVIGLIVPPREPFLHPDTRLHPGVRFEVEGLGIDEMTAEDFDTAVEGIGAAAMALGRRGVDAIALLGTSLSFYRGPDFNASLEKTLREHGGCPAVTASTAVVDALRAHGATRLAVGTAYDSTMNERLEAYLVACGFEVAAMVGMNIRNVREAMAVRDAAILDIARSAREAAAGADALLLSCGAFATGHLLPELQRRCGKPIVSTTPAALAAAISSTGA